MNAEDRQRWRQAITNAEKYLAPKRRVWRRLQKAYALELDVPGFPPEDVVRVARFYPQARQLITAIAFRYPFITMKVEDEGYRYGVETLERAGNAALRLMKAKREIQQAAFDALFCYRGWIKFGYNPPGSSDIVAPYVLADDLCNDFPYVQRVSPYNMLVDPLTPPHNLSYARYLIEKMLVPLEFVKKDDRFAHRAEIQPLRKGDLRDEILLDLQEDPTRPAEEQQAYEEALGHGEMVLLYEIHDRLHRRRIVLAEGVDEPVEDIDHPLLEQEPIIMQDPVDGQSYPTGDYQPTGAWLCEGGFPYHSITYDLACEEPYGNPMMEYVEDEQQVITESATRRADLLKRMARIILGQMAEKEEDPDIESKLKNSRDATVLWVKDIDKAFREVQWGSLPQDQLGIESDMRHYEEQVLQVSQLAMAGSSRMTATQASLIASFGQLNREWLQEAITEAYRVTVRNTLRIMSDPRYTPDKFIIAFGEDAAPVYQAISADMLRVGFQIHIEAASMRPLFEELEREDTLALVNYLMAVPEVDKREVVQLILRTFRVPNPERFMGPDQDANEIRAAQLENQFMASRLQDPGVLPTQKHGVHAQVHQQAVQDPAVVQFLQAQMQINPQVAVGFQMLLQQHLQAHAQAAQQQQAGGGPGAQRAQAAKARPSVREQGTRQPMEAAGNLQSSVRSNAQRMGQAVSINPEQN